MELSFIYLKEEKFKLLHKSAVKLYVIFRTAIVPGPITKLPPIQPILRPHLDNLIGPASSVAIITPSLALDILEEVLVFTPADVSLFVAPPSSANKRS